MFPTIWNEGYGQAIICNSCTAQNNWTEILESREQENWRGLVITPVKTKSNYLKKTFARENFEAVPVFHKIPILKSGDSKKLQAIRFGSKKIGYINTCAFDALHQLFLVTATTVPTFKQRIVDHFSTVVAS